MKQWIGAVVAVLLCPAALCAAEKRTLTVEEAVALALKNSKILHISSMKVEAAAEQRKETGTLLKPSVSAGASYTRLNDITPYVVGGTTLYPNLPNVWSFNVSVKQAIYTGKKLENIEKAAGFSATAVEHDRAHDETEIMFQVKNAYWGLYKAIRVKEVLDENVEQVKLHLKDVQNMVDAGIMLRDEALKVQVQLSNTQFAQLDAGNNVRLAMMVLNDIMGLAIDSEIVPTSKLSACDASFPSPKAYLDEAMANRADIKAGHARVQAATVSAEAVRGDNYPQVGIFGDFLYQNPYPRSFPPHDQFDSAWDLGIGVTLNIFDWGRVKHQSGRAEAERSQAEWAFEKIRDAVTLEVNQSLLGLRQAKERIEISGKAVEQAAESLRITRNRFANGHATNADVLDTDVALLQAQLNQTIAVVDYEVARAQMVRATGAGGEACR